MAIVATVNDTVFDILRKLQNSGFEIVSISFIKSTDFFSIKIEYDNRSVKIVHQQSDLCILSDFQKAIFAKTALIFDDLSYEELK